MIIDDGALPPYTEKQQRMLEFLATLLHISVPELERRLAADSLGAVELILGYFACKLPTGDYWVEFFDYRGELINASVAAYSLDEARKKAVAYCPMVKAASWRILCVVAQSTDNSHSIEGVGVEAGQE